MMNKNIFPVYQLNVTIILEVLYLIATLEIVNILDRAEDLSEIILQSEVMVNYEKARVEMNNDEEAQKLIKAFNDIKDSYEEVERFGRYHPDYNKIMKNVRMTKREMDMNEKVAQFKIAERNLQRLLDDVSEIIAYSVSEQIKVPKDGAALTDTGCSSGACASGEACSCRAS